MVEYTRKKAFVIIALSTFLVSGSCLLAFLFFKLHKSEAIGHIIQSSSKYLALDNLCLEELLHLSTDHPTKIEDFDISKGESLLMASHVFEKVSIKKMKPDILYVDYEMKEPFAIYGELSNTYVNKEGFLFPAYPFFTPKKLPEIYIGQQGMKWGSKIDLSIVHAILEKLPGSRVTRIDLSQMEGSILGKKEIVVFLNKHHILRLPVEDYQEALEHYLLLNKVRLHQEKRDAIIDLRLKEMAFIEFNRM